jgi:hypothetical protein
MDFTQSALVWLLLGAPLVLAIIDFAKTGKGTANR